MKPLFDSVISASGLSPVFARSAITRACARASVVPEKMSAADLQRSLPEIEKALRVFLAPDELARRMAALASLAR